MPSTSSSVLPAVEVPVRSTGGKAVDYHLVARREGEDTRIIQINNQVAIGGEQLVVMAGPCAVESPEQMLEIARQMRDLGVQVMRGGAFKPRTSPYAFPGLKEKGLQILLEVSREVGLPVVTEVMDVRDLELVAENVDIVQIGSRNMHNFSLLREAGTLRKPVLLKRGLSATIEEWLMAAEYIAAGGNLDIILCERGIRTFETHTRNTVDISAVPAVKELSYLPVIVDPSHGTGRRQMVNPLARAAIAAGADGLLIEVHPDPDRALCDGPQSLDPGQFARLLSDLQPIAAAVNRRLI